MGLLNSMRPLPIRQSLRMLNTALLADSILSGIAPLNCKHVLVNRAQLPNIFHGDFCCKNEFECGLAEHIARPGNLTQAYLANDYFRVDCTRLCTGVFDSLRDPLF
jgi:hypothetical protein